MKKITIAERLRPFSHTPGTTFVVPYTSWSVRVFPTRLEFFDLEEKNPPFFWDFDFVGPLRGFTAQLDLEKGRIHVFGMSPKGPIRYFISADNEGICLDQTLLFPCKLKKIFTNERLSLGMHKAQDWDLIKRRLDCREIFPHWLLLGALSSQNGEGNFPLLEKCKEVIQNKDKQHVLQPFEELFLAHFQGVLSPRCKDGDYHGILHQGSSNSPLSLLTEGSKLIRSLFVQSHGNEVAILPCLPPHFHSGRLLNTQILEGVTLDLEWSKKTLKKMQIKSRSAQQVIFMFPKRMSSFRLNGKDRHCVDDRKHSMILLPSKTLWLDRFMF